jgi:hypothetical protein
MNDLSLLIKGNKVDLSESQVTDIVKILMREKLSREKMIVAEFTSLFLKYYEYDNLHDATNYLPYIEDGILYVKLPQANTEWTIAIFKATADFCGDFCGDFCVDEHYPDFSKSIAKSGYVSIRI